MLYKYGDAIKKYRDYYNFKSALKKKKIFKVEKGV